MKIVDVGVSNASFMDFTIPSDFARQALYYCPQFGHFYCNDNYYIERDFLDLFLLMYVCHGSLTVETQGRTYIANQGEIVLLDCRQPHRYYCKNSVDFLWFHFHGNSSIAYSEYLYTQSGVVFTGERIPELYRNFMAIIQGANAVIVNEHQISLNINQILCHLVNIRQNNSSTNSLLLPAIAYIRENYSTPITLDHLANLCLISKPHLIRCFKKHMSCTPHEYLLAYRLRQSKQQLIGTSLSVETIAEECGFNSASHFTRAFRKSTGITPTEFRKLQF